MLCKQQKEQPHFHSFHSSDSTQIIKVEYFKLLEMQLILQEVGDDLFQVLTSQWDWALSGGEYISQVSRTYLALANERIVLTPREEGAICCCTL